MRNISREVNSIKKAKEKSRKFKDGNNQIQSKVIIKKEDLAVEL